MREFMYREFGEGQEEHHWWFRARRAIVADVLRRRYRPDGSPVIDLGCGTGGMLSLLKEFGPVTGVDPSPLAREYCKSKHGVDVLDARLPDSIPVGAGTQGLACLFDVIEHIDDDVETLRQAIRVLKPGGMVIVTVPACPFLWARHDEVNEHKRRYTRAGLVSALTAAGFAGVRASYCNFWLFPVIAVVRLAQRMFRWVHKPSTESCDLTLTPRGVGEILCALMSSEKYLIRRCPLPFGASLIATAVKP